MSEKALTRKILLALNALPGCKAIKLHGGRYLEIGTPDLIGCYRGLCFLIEVKDGPKPKLSKMQERRILEWRGASALVAVLRDRDDLVAFLNELEEWRKRYVG